MQKLTYLSLAIVLAAGAGAAAAQPDPIGAAKIQPVAPPQPQAPEAAAAQPAPSTFQAPAITVEWNPGDAKELLAYIERVGEEGLSPADYQPSRLRAAIDSGDNAQLSSVATELFLRLSSDLSLGHVRGDSRIDWHINDPDLNGNEQYAMMERAVQNHSVRDTLTSLLPTHPQYNELKSVLAATPKSDKKTIDKIRTNLDRWRWLPRDLGQKYVIVNVPAYMVALVENGQVVARRRAVSGAPKTATPQLTATISGVIFNPWWEVPQSITPEVRGKKGYVAVKNEEGKIVRYRQPPGPSNALGRMKLVMPNAHAIFLHDTNAKGLFNKQARAYSHGCIRTEDAIGFAQILLESTEWNKETIGKALATGKPVQADLAAPIPVYITYFTAAALADKAQIVAYDDIYGRDKPVVTALNSTAADKTKMASSAD